MISTPRYAVLGHPIAHSLSPILQNGWMREHGIDGVYEALDLEPVGFERALDSLFENGLMGANVTLPFKERAAAHLRNLAASAKASGSVNCLTRGETEFIGHSTDGAGFIADLDARAQGWRSISGHVVVIGAGGAARAIVTALLEAGKSELQLVNRSLDRAIALASQFSEGSVRVMGWDLMPDSLHGAGLVINATSAGLNGQNPLTPDFSVTHGDCLIYDSVYAPRETAFLAAGKGANRQTLDGLGMLVGQGALAFEMWFDVLPDQQGGLKRLEAALKP